jgi:hypothetical protein
MALQACVRGTNSYGLMALGKTLRVHSGLSQTLAVDAQQLDHSRASRCSRWVRHAAWWGLYVWARGVWDGPAVGAIFMATAIIVVALSGHTLGV